MPRKTHGGTNEARRKRRRGRGRKTPKWLLDTKELDLIAQRRCLMILAVLSGEKSVEDASREVEISPAQYYQFEKKALMGMLAALMPGASTDGTNAPVTKQLEQRVAVLEVAKRRLERLLFLTRLTVKPGPMTSGKRGRPRKMPVLVSEPAGAKRSPFTKKKWTRKASRSSSNPPSVSTPMVDGEDAL